METSNWKDSDIGGDAPFNNGNTIEQFKVQLSRVLWSLYIWLEGFVMLNNVQIVQECDATKAQ